MCIRDRAWGLTIILGLLVGILLPPLLALTLPALAYAQFDLYRIVFPPPVSYTHLDVYKRQTTPTGPPA